MPSKLNKMTHNQDHRSHLFTQISLKMKNKTNPSLQYKLVLSKVNKVVVPFTGAAAFVNIDIHLPHIKLINFAIAITAPLAATIHAVHFPSIVRVVAGISNVLILFSLSL